MARRSVVAPLALVPEARKRPLEVLCLGAHPDDIEIGCGGTVLELLGARRGVRMHWVVFSGQGTAREAEARAGAKRFLKRAGAANVAVHGFRDGFFPHQGDVIKAAFERLKRDVSPDLVLTHTRDDRHQDHRVVSDLTWNTFRSHLVLEYEIPKYDGDLGAPNVFVPLKRTTAAAKVRHLMATFATQRSKRWFRPSTFEAMHHLRGIESGHPSGLAEAFYARKAVLSLTSK